MRSLILLALLGFAAGASYHGYKVYKISPHSETENAYLQSLETNPDFDFWSKVNKVGRPVTLMVSPQAQPQFESKLKTFRTDYLVTIQDVERAFQAERLYHNSRKPLKSGRITFDQYLRHDEINAYLDQLAQDYPDTVTIETLGQSYQNRTMNLIRISTGTTDPPKPVIFIDAGIHAREWIAPAVALYLINQLVENPDNSDLIQDVDWHIIPSLNPDGYEFTWTDDRLWRKTMSLNAVCTGADANRNFGYHWMEAGASDNQCSDIYAGRTAFSEVEAQNLRDYLAKTPNIKAYLSFHSFAQCILYPWSYDDVLPDNADELQALGESIADAIKAVAGTEYIVGATTETLYAAAGASQDWAMGGAGINIVYSMELPGGGLFGFDPPPSEIEPIVTETFVGLRVFGQYFVGKH